MFFLLIPVINIIFLIVVFYTKNKSLSKKSFDLSFFYSITWYTFFMFAVAELSSLISCYERSIVMVCHMCHLLLCISIAVYRLRLDKSCISDLLSIRQYNKQDFIVYKYEYLFRIFFILLCLTGLYIALYTVPYNWDSLAFRLPRVIQWIQNKSIKYFATNYLQEAESPVLPEIIVSQIYMISKCNERALNLVQNASYIFNAFAVYKITGLLGCSKVWKRIATVIFMTMPIAFAESFSTQTDEFSAVWVLLFVYYLLYIVKQDTAIKRCQSYYLHYTFMGISVGLAFESKPNVMISIAWFALFLIFFCIYKRYDMKVAFKLCLFVIVSALVIILPEFIRIYSGFGTLFPSMGGSIMLVQTMNPRLLFMNFIKGFSYNLPVNIFSFSPTVIIKIVESFEKVLNVDMNADSICWHKYNLNGYGTYNHDSAMNPMIAWLFLFGLLYFFIRKLMEVSRLKRGMLRQKKVMFDISDWYVVLTSLSVFSLLTVNRFTEHNVRYQLSFWALWCPMVAYVINKYVNSKSVRNVILGCILSLSFISYVNQFVYHYGVSRTYLSNRSQGYFHYGSVMYEGYCDFIKNLKAMKGHRIGMIIPGYFIYPMMAMMNEYGDYIYTSVNVTNETKKFSDSDIHPDIIVYIAEDCPDTDLTCNGMDYKREYFLDDSYRKYAIYVVNRS